MTVLPLLSAPAELGAGRPLAPDAPDAVPLRRARAGHHRTGLDLLQIALAGLPPAQGVLHDVPRRRPLPASALVAAHAPHGPLAHEAVPILRRADIRVHVTRRHLLKRAAAGRAIPVRIDLRCS